MSFRLLIRSWSCSKRAEQGSIQSTIFILIYQLLKYTTYFQVFIKLSELKTIALGWVLFASCSKLISLTNIFSPRSILCCYKSSLQFIISPGECRVGEMDLLNLFLRYCEYAYILSCVLSHLFNRQLVHAFPQYPVRIQIV